MYVMTADINTVLNLAFDFKVRAFFIDVEYVYMNVNFS